jgi:spore coat polysaccharide biosynthesis protein SpsF (cytidylyltransferase family)
MQILAIIQARTGSSRLPNKILLNLDGKTILDHVIDRVLSTTMINETIIAYPMTPANLPIAEICAERGLLGYAGSENDVLDRYYQCARIARPEHVVRITSDCPLIDFRLIDKVVALHIEENASYTSNRLNKPAWPDGEDVEIFTYKALERAWKYADTLYEREHVSPYMKTDKANKMVHYPAPHDMSDIKYSLDTMEDYKEIVRRYFDK